MPERKPCTIERSVPTHRLLKFVREVDLRKLPEHASKVHEALQERKKAA